jgi:glycosyltransferase involved in cell wall biosynthesis
LPATIPGISRSAREIAADNDRHWTSLGHFRSLLKQPGLVGRRQQEINESQGYGYKHPDRSRFTFEMIVEASGRHFAEIDFIFKIGNASDLIGRKKRTVKTIALYYHRLHNGGTERVTAWQIGAWTKLGYKVVLLADESRSERDYPYPDNVKRIILPPKMMDGGNGEYVTRGRVLGETLLEVGADLLVTNLAHEICTVWDILIAKSLDIPVILGWHNVFDANFHNGADLDLARIRLYGYRYADLICVLNEMDQMWFTMHGYAARVMRNPPTFKHLPDRTSPLSGKTVVWVGRVERHQKRIDQAIQMFPFVLLKHPDAELLIVGDGPDLKWAKEQAIALGISSRVRFTGYTTDVASYLKTASIHLMTSEFEGYGLVFEEAWSHGLPTVMYEMPYLELMKPGKGYVAVAQGDVRSLAATISHLLENEELRRTIGNEARLVAEEFGKFDLEQAWQRIFEDIATKDCMGPALEELNVPRDCQILINRLGDKLIPAPDASIRPPLLNRKMSSLVRGLKYLERRTVTPFRKRLPFFTFSQLKMIDLTRVPLGDNLMIWTGLYTLLDHGLPVCEIGCRLHVHPVLVSLGQILFEGFGIQVVAGPPQEISQPFYTPHPPNTLSEWWSTYVGKDWYMDWVEATDRQKTINRADYTEGLKRLIRLSISERIIWRRKEGWKGAPQAYNGYRLWWPLALRLGVYPVVFQSMMCQSLQSIRGVLNSFVDDLIRNDPTPAFSGYAAFPTANAFQTIDPETYKIIMQDVGMNKFTCFVQDDSPWRESYRLSGIVTTHVPSIEDTFKIIRSAKVVLTCCSFTSHVAQLLRDDFIVVLFVDLSTIHPGASPIVLSSPPGCSPCNYMPRARFSRCAAGYEHCVALENAGFQRRIADELKIRCH